MGNFIPNIIKFMKLPEGAAPSYKHFYKLYNLLSKLSSKPLLKPNSRDIDFTDFKILLELDKAAISRLGSDEVLMFSASRYGFIDLLNILLAKKINVNFTNNSWAFRTAFMFASMGSHIEILNVLLASGADLHAVDSYGKTALMYAGSVGVVKFLLSRGINIDAVDDQGNTALIEAVKSHKIGSVKALLEAGADDNVVNYCGQTVLMIAASFCNKDLVELLLEKGADVTGNISIQ